MLPYVIAGLVSGAIYGLAGAGLVLTYKTSGVFNFAHGAVATVGAYAFYLLHVEHGLPWPWAAALVLVIGAPVGGVLFAVLARSLATAGLAMKVVATVGVLLAVQALVEMLSGGGRAKEVPSFLPTQTVTIAGAAVSYEKIIIFVIALVATMGLWVFFRSARLGVAMRAVVDDPALLDMAGTNPHRVRQASWTVGVGFALLSGLLLAPSVPLNGTTLTLLVVQAFGAAALGAFRSLPMTFAGGLSIGVLGSVATKYWTEGILAQVPSSLPFVVLFITLLLLPRRWLQAKLVEPLDRRPMGSLPARFQLALAAAVLVGLALVPDLVGFRLTVWTVALTNVIIFVSLGLLVRTSGQVSLAHVGFAAIGASTFHHLAVGQSWPWAIALLGAGLVAAPVGALLAIPAARLGGIYLALATLGFGISLAQMFYTSDLMFGEIGLGLEMPRPSWGGMSGDENFYYLVLAITVAAVAGVTTLERGRLGRLLRGISASPLALASSGVSVNVSRVLVFCLSAFLAAIAGALAGMAQFTTSAVNYPPLLSLTYLSLLIICVGGMPWYALQAGLAITLIPAYVEGSHVTSYLTLASGLGAVVLALLAQRKPPARLVNLLRSRPRSASTTPAPLATVPAEGRVAPLSLDVQGLGVSFGGVKAVEAVHVQARTDHVTGLIGPNGAGKTTTLNAISGIVRPATGRVLVDTGDVTARSVAARARKGIGRTFQVMELLDHETVRTNVAMGAEGHLAGWNPLRQLLALPGDSRRIRAATDDALALCGLGSRADALAGGLSTGERRLVELARCVASDQRLLLLDEPSSGLDRDESTSFVNIVSSLVRERGVGILLVEHDISVVRALCDEVFVLDFGVMIAEGPTSEVLDSPALRAAYLGTISIEEVRA